MVLSPPGKVSSTALVRYRLNDYSVPATYGFRDVLVKGFVDEVAIICGAVEIAHHPRSYDRGEFIFEPRHPLALLEQKPGALDQAAPLQCWILLESLQHLRRLLEARAKFIESLEDPTDEQVRSRAKADHRHIIVSVQQRPSAETAAMLFWPLLASGQIMMRKVDGWQSLAEKPSDQVL